MAMIKIPNYNRIINLYFLTKDGLEINRVKCPARGRKPDIEITGSIMADNFLPAFTITVKNLYLNVSGDRENPYAKIKVEAGYEQNYITFTGQIVSLFQESPGPDGKTVIMCQLGLIDSWLTATVDLDEDPGASMQSIVEKISKSLGMQEAQIPPALADLTVQDRFTFQGKCSEAIAKLIKTFPEKKLFITEKDGALQVASKEDGTSLVTKKINFLSSPPQQNPGEGDGAFYSTFTAPWLPNLRPGERVEFPAWQYIRYFNVVNNATNTNTILVTSIQFHFGTVGSVNQMTVQGPGVK